MPDIGMYEPGTSCQGPAPEAEEQPAFAHTPCAVHIENPFRKRVPLLKDRFKQPDFILPAYEEPVLLPVNPIAQSFVNHEETPLFTKFYLKVYYRSNLLDSSAMRLDRGTLVTYKLKEGECRAFEIQQ